MSSGEQISAPLNSEPWPHESSGVRNLEVSASGFSKPGLAPGKAWLNEGLSLCRTVRSLSEFKVHLFGEGSRVVWGLKPLEKKDRSGDSEEQGLTVIVVGSCLQGEDTQIEGAKEKSELRNRYWMKVNSPPFKRGTHFQQAVLGGY